MYGTIWRVRPKAGKEQEVIQMMQEWERERRPKTKGVVAALVYKLDNGGLMSAVAFESKDAYRANAEDPEQDAFYRRWRDLLEEDPEWNDGEVVSGWGSIPG